MATAGTAGGGEKREQEMVRLLVAGFALVHGAVALIMFLVLEQDNADHFCQCMESCLLLSMVEVCSILFHHVFHVTMTVCTVVQMLLAALALASCTGRLRRAASFLALCITVATGMQSIRLVYTALFGTHCCFSGGIVQVAFAIAVVFTQGAISFWGGVVSFQLRRASCREL